MKIKFLCLLMLIFFILPASCNRQKEQPAGQTDAVGSIEENRPQDNSPPQVITASITPESPARDDTLTVQVIGEDRDKEPVSFTFRWFVDDALVQEGSQNTLEPGFYRKGSRIYVEIVPSDSFGSGESIRTDTVIVRNTPPMITNVALGPSAPKVGDVITAEVEGMDLDGGDITYLYQWQINWKNAGQPRSEATFNTGMLKKGDIVAVLVTASDGEVMGTPYLSQGITLTNSGPEIISSPPSITESSGGRYVYPVIARDRDGDRLMYRLVTGPQGMTINSSTGVLTWTLPTRIDGRQDIPVKIAVNDGDGGEAIQEFSLTLEMK